MPCWWQQVVGSCRACGVPDVITTTVGVLGLRVAVRRSGGVIAEHRPGLIWSRPSLGQPFDDVTSTHRRSRPARPSGNGAATMPAPTTVTFARPHAYPPAISSSSSRPGRGPVHEGTAMRTRTRDPPAMQTAIAACYHAPARLPPSTRQSRARFPTAKAIFRALAGIPIASAPLVSCPPSDLQSERPLRIAERHHVPGGPARHSGSSRSQAQPVSGRADWADALPPTGVPGAS